ncbi:MAG: hypothetical protein N3C63_01950 [Rhodocyclaceae bacterium]|nr:hypothetical protein [Rhodocyclaceae bacterium]
MRRWLACCWLLIAAAAWGEEGLRLAPGFAIQKLPAAMMPAGAWPTQPALCVRKDGLWFATRENLYRLGARAGVLEVPLPLEGFACSAQGTPVLVAAGKLGPVAGRLFVPRVPLPSPATRIASGTGDSLILFETAAPARLFRFDGRQAQLVATLTEPILAAAPAGDFVLVATATGIFRVRPGEPLGLLFPLADMKPVVSLAVHPRTAEILFATEDEIFLLDDGRATQLAEGLGGALAATETTVFVADGRRQGIYALRPAR